jgi:hypothetical protein
MTINTQKLREAAANAKSLTTEDLIGFRLTATAHITGLARAIESCCDHIDAQTAEIAAQARHANFLNAEIARLREALKPLAEVDLTELPPNDFAWFVLRARAALSGESNG